MNQKTKDSWLRATVDMDLHLKGEIQNMAMEKKWSFSYMGYVLLKQAVKERNRKKKSPKNDTIS